MHRHASTPWVRQVARALREDKQELKTREKEKKPKDAQRIRGIVHENECQEKRNMSRTR